MNDNDIPKSEQTDIPNSDDSHVVTKHQTDYTQEQSLENNHITGSQSQKNCDNQQRIDDTEQHHKPSIHSKKKNNSLLFKVMTMVIVCFGFLIGLLFISELVDERQKYHKIAIQQIKKVHASDQLIMSPFIIISNTKYSDCDFSSTMVKETAIKRRDNCLKSAKVIAPVKSVWKHDVQVSDDQHHIGIYNAISYRDKLNINSEFSIDNTLQDHDMSSENLLNDKRAKLILSVMDLKSMAKIPFVTINGKKYNFTFPKKQEYLGLNYVELELPKNFFNTGTKTKLTMNLQVEFKGIDTLSTMPFSDNVEMHMKSNWLDPQFFGITAQDKKLNNNGFTANWFNIYQSISNKQKLTSCAEKNVYEKCDFYQHEDNVFGLKFIQATNAYTFTDRTIKYALLLLTIVFGAFFLFEVTKNLRIHPIQYSLVGVALLVFYVLLLSLSEQLAFSTAYLISATGCVGLISWYVSYVLESIGRAGVFAGILTALYSCFYYIIQSEDNSLIIGSVFMFCVVAIAMFFTRNIDWYEKD